MTPVFTYLVGKKQRESNQTTREPGLRNGMMIMTMTLMLSSRCFLVKCYNDFSALYTSLAVFPKAMFYVLSFYLVRYYSRYFYLFLDHAVSPFTRPTLT